jgi:16S rRNA C967 or C1407 C5-methylase (RsmB/RsmF family)
VLLLFLLQLDGELVQPPRPLPWYPSNLGWHMNFSRNQLRKLSWLAAIHEFMKVANEAGSITRQEAVSMVPPLFMDVQPHHRVSCVCVFALHLLTGVSYCEGKGF